MKIVTLLVVVLSLYACSKPAPKVHTEAEAEISEAPIEVELPPVVELIPGEDLNPEFCPFPAFDKFWTESKGWRRSFRQGIADVEEIAKKFGHRDRVYALVRMTRAAEEMFERTPVRGFTGELRHESNSAAYAWGVIYRLRYYQVVWPEATEELLDLPPAYFK